MKNNQTIPRKEVILTAEETRTAIIDFARRKGEVIPDRPKLQISYANSTYTHAELNWYLE